MSVYPTGIDSFLPVVSGVSEIAAQDVIDLQDSVLAIQNVLGDSGNKFNFFTNNIYPVKDVFDISSIQNITGNLDGSRGTLHFELSRYPIDNPAISIATATPITVPAPSSWSWFGFQMDSSGNVYDALSSSRTYYKLDMQTDLLDTYFYLNNKNIIFSDRPFTFYKNDISTDILCGQYLGVIYKCNITGLTTQLVAGQTPNQSGFYGDGIPATGCLLTCSSMKPASDSSGNLYFINENSGYVRRVDATTGIITTYAGNGTTASQGVDGVLATGTAIGSPIGIVLDADDNLYIACPTTACRIRKVDKQTGIISNFAGSGASGYGGDGGAAALAQINFSSANSLIMSFDVSGSLYFPDYNTHRIRQVTNAGIISTVMGNGTFGSTPGVSITGACISNPSQIIWNRGEYYVADTGGQRLVWSSGGITYSHAALSPPSITPYTIYTNVNLGYAINPVDVTPTPYQMLKLTDNTYYGGDVQYSVFWSGTKNIDFVYDVSGGTRPSGLIVTYFSNDPQ